MVSKNSFASKQSNAGSKKGAEKNDFFDKVDLLI